ncbi:hypothetical protein EVG20_g11101, partial [Dentipellis fragilis]
MRPSPSTTLSALASQTALAPPAVQAVEKKLSVIEASKRLAAWTAVDKHIRPEHKVIGIGSGSTVPYIIECIVAQGDDMNRDRVFLPTGASCLFLLVLLAELCVIERVSVLALALVLHAGFQSKELIVKGKLRLGDVDQYPVIDVTIDGADEVDGDLNCIKGGGACHLREKVLAEAAVTFIVVADYRKNSKVLGTNYKKGVPIEVAPFAYAKLLQNLRNLGSPTASLRMATEKAGPVVSDNGNFVIDAPFPEEQMRDPYT